MGQIIQQYCFLPICWRLQYSIVCKHICGIMRSLPQNIQLLQVGLHVGPYSLFLQASHVFR